jgi:arylamine N-acetyltransferase
MRNEPNNKTQKLTKDVKSLTREDLIERRLKIVESFSADDLKNPITRESVKIAFENIDKELAKKK